MIVQGRVLGMEWARPLSLFASLGSSMLVCCILAVVLVGLGSTMRSLAGD